MKVVRSNEKSDDRRLESLLELEPDLAKLVIRNSPKNIILKVFAHIVAYGMGVAIVTVFLINYFESTGITP